MGNLFAALKLKELNMAAAAAGGKVGPAGGAGLGGMGGGLVAIQSMSTGQQLGATVADTVTGAGSVYSQGSLSVAGSGM